MLIFSPGCVWSLVLLSYLLLSGCRGSVEERMTKKRTEAVVVRNEEKNMIMMIRTKGITIIVMRTTTIGTRETSLMLSANSLSGAGSPSVHARHQCAPAAGAARSWRQQASAGHGCGREVILSSSSSFSFSSRFLLSSSSRSARCRCRPRLVVVAVVRVPVPVFATIIVYASSTITSTASTNSTIRWYPRFSIVVVILATTSGTP